MAGYLIVNMEVTDPKGYEEYGQKVAPIVAKFGGHYIVRGGDVRALEGNFPIKLLVIVEFPSVEAVQKFYDSPEYQPLLKLRLACTRSDAILAPGYSEP
jgi:uncharacterized protein (DUF1330 family)